MFYKAFQIKSGYVLYFIHQILNALVNYAIFANLNPLLIKSSAFKRLS